VGQPFPANSKRLDPYKNFKFRLKWDGKYVYGGSKVSGLKRTTEVVEFRSGGDPSTSHIWPFITGRDWYGISAPRWGRRSHWRISAKISTWNSITRLVKWSWRTRFIGAGFRNIRRCPTLMLMPMPSRLSISSLRTKVLSGIPASRSRLSRH
jgi:hypothetical protein